MSRNSLFTPLSEVVFIRLDGVSLVA